MAIPENPIAGERWPDQPMFPREFFIRCRRRPPTASRVDTDQARRRRIRYRTNPIEASHVEAGQTRQRSFERCWGLPTNDNRHRAAPDDASIFPRPDRGSGARFGYLPLPIHENASMRKTTARIPTRIDTPTLVGIRFHQGFAGRP